MKKSIFLTFIILLISTAFLLVPALAVETKDTKTTQIRKQPEIQQVKPRKPVRIKLKRSTEGKYTWDLSGDDADEIVKADKRLRKLLSIE
jgi:cytochrome c oxidase assembly protein Cox11